ncbi:ABC transporter permease [Rothia nasimurium]|uniref:FtsX-like permease family protein n=1 Tax=Luteibacter anthropi TaxID=564369 RepID=A0A7X5ZH30_9GAMM|nr:FtsX-like permease family protein [Luteibacter anthropi]
MIAASVALGEGMQAWRGLLRRPGFLTLAVFTLALGIATVTAVFAMIDQALLKPLPFPDAGRLVTLGSVDDVNENIAAPGYYAPLKRLPGIESAGMLMNSVINVNIAPGGHPEVALALRADGGFFRTLGMPMALGRNFDEAEDLPHGPRAVILSDAFWRSRFRADPAVVGGSLQVEGRPAQIVGVLPKDFAWPRPFDLAMSLQPDLNDTDLSVNQLIVGRLRPDTTVSSMSAQVAATLTPLLLAGRRDVDRVRGYLAAFPPNALPLMTSVFAASTGKTVWLFMGAAVCVLLIAGINLASLILLRSLSRTHATAVRAALGSSPGRLSLPALAEGLLIGTLGAVGGLLLAWMGLRMLEGVIPPEWLRGATIRLGATSIAFAFLAGLVAALAATLLAILRARRRDWRGELVSGGRTGMSREDSRTGRALVVAQVAVAVVLLMGAALFTRTVQKLESVPMGFTSHAVGTFTLSPVRERYVSVADATTLARRVVERLQALPGVVQAGLSTNLPTGNQLNYSLTMPDGRNFSAQYRLVSPGFLDTVGVPLLAGRGIVDTDAGSADPVCVVSMTFARRYLGDEPLGKRVSIPTGDDTMMAMRVVGIVGDVRQYGPAEEAPGILYAPVAQMPASIWSVLREFGPFSFAVRRQPGVPMDETALRDAVAAVDNSQPIANVRSLDAVVAGTTSAQRLNLLLVGLFAGLALLLASVGLYAVMSVVVASHRHEYGVRAALGATRSRLLQTVLRAASIQLGLGLAIGLGAALALSRLLESFLFGIAAVDPLAIAAVLLVLGVSGVLASLPPAWRAARVRPMQALRMD